MTPRYRKGGWVRPADLPKGPSGRPLCRWCGTETRPPRRTFCSAACVHQHRIRTNGSYLRQQVFRRDNGVCRGCGLDTKVVAAELLELRVLHGLAEMRRAQQLHGIPLSRTVWRRKLGGGLWDADHIVPVVEGGGEAGLDNLQTLCIPCHREKTRRRRRWTAKAAAGAGGAAVPTVCPSGATEGSS